MKDREHYEIVASEIEQGMIDKALWTQAFAEAGGIDNVARAKYITLRVRELRQVFAQRQKEEAQRIREQQRKAAEQRRAEPPEELPPGTERLLNVTAALMLLAAFIAIIAAFVAAGRG